MSKFDFSGIDDGNRSEAIASKTHEDLDRNVKFFTGFIENYEKKKRPGLVVKLISGLESYIKIFTISLIPPISFPASKVSVPINLNQGHASCVFEAKRVFNTLSSEWYRIENDLKAHHSNIEALGRQVQDFDRWLVF